MKHCVWHRYANTLRHARIPILAAARPSRRARTIRPPSERDRSLSIGVPTALGMLTVMSLMVPLALPPAASAGMGTVKALFTVGPRCSFSAPAPSVGQSADPSFALCAEAFQVAAQSWSRTCRQMSPKPAATSRPRCRWMTDHRRKRLATSTPTAGRSAARSSATETDFGPRSRCLIDCSQIVSRVWSSFLSVTPLTNAELPWTSIRSHVSPGDGDGPTITLEGSGSLWAQNAPGEWVWNPAGDPWPLPFAASDPSGVCELYITVAGNAYVAPGSIPVPAPQCPETLMTWTADVDTRAAMSGAGSLPIALVAADPAGLASSDSETVKVDNVPIVVSLQAVNDPNPSLWVDHAVTIDVTPRAGPSGVGRTDCSVDDLPLQPYPAQGVTVDGDGVHTVSCTAWNNAVGPQGQHASGTNSLSVYIDEVPPSIRFEPRTASDPTELVVDTADDESGVAGGSIQMAPAATDDWENLPTRFDDGQLAAQVEDDDRKGPYILRASSCDNAGNCGSTTEAITLPLRIPPDSLVSLTRIAQPIRHRVVYKRVLVDWHWATVRLDGRPVRVKSGGHLETIRVVETIQWCPIESVRTEPGHRQGERSCTTPQPHLTKTLTVRYGRGVTIHGLFTTGQGVPLPGQTVDIYASVDNHAGGFHELSAVTTAADGSWTATLPPGPSRVIRAVTYGTATILPSTAQVTAIVPADIRLLRVWPRRISWGGTVHLTGQLFGSYLPPGGALVRLRIGYGSTYETYGVQEHVTGDGRFSTIATFGSGDASTFRAYWFQIASLPMGDYPYAPGASERVAVTVGGTPG